ncbi:hypothetical protein BMT54_04995 [Pasteurellaceae bacterium 15-036681]|nr:hypothetical protein BMT54_04995 [Pasteurellaceae bacterium 15-036681]
MLYTFAKAQYDLEELKLNLAQIGEQDAILLWQDGVLLMQKYPTLFQDKHIYLLESDVVARGLNLPNTISLSEFASLTERYFPQVSF